MQTQFESPFAQGTEIPEDEFFRRVDEDSDWQYLGGKPVMAAAASNRHEDVFSFLLTLLRVYLDERGGGSVRGSRYPMRLDPSWSPEPDLLVVGEGKAARMTDQRLEGPADLVIEIASETDPDFDRREKLPRYLAAQIPEIWLIDPFETSVLVQVWQPSGYVARKITAGRLDSAVVRDFWIEVDWLWQDELPSTLGCLRQILA